MRLARPPGMPPPPSPRLSTQTLSLVAGGQEVQGAFSLWASVSSLHSEGVRRKGPHRTPGSQPGPCHCLKHLEMLRAIPGCHWDQGNHGI